MANDLLKGLPLATRTQLRREALRLLAMLPDAPEAQAARDTVQYLIPKTARGKAKRKLKVTEFPLAAMLRDRPTPNCPRMREVDQLRTWALIAALRFCHEYGESDQFSTVEHGLRVVRRIAAQKSAATFWAAFPEVSGDLWALQCGLMGLQDRLQKRGDRAAMRVGHLLCLISHAANPHAPRFMPSGITRSKRDWPDFAWSVQTQDQAQVHSGPADGSDIVHAPRTQEEADDLADPQVIELESADDAGDLAVQLDLTAILDRDEGWIADFAALSRDECRALWAQVDKEMTRAQPDAGAIWCAASLIFGRSVVDLAGYAMEPSHPGQSWWHTGRDGPCLCFAPDVTKASKSTMGNNGIKLIPPQAVQVSLTRVLGQSPQAAEAAAREWLHRHSHGRSPRLARLKDTVARQEHEGAIIFWKV